MSPVFSTLASWMPVFWGATVSLLLWFVGLQIKRGTWRKNFGPDAGHDWLMGVLMGIIWFVATIPYGMGAYYLGRLGTSVGWAVVHGLHAARRQHFRIYHARVDRRAAACISNALRRPCGLIMAIIVLAIGNSMTWLALSATSAD